MVFVPVDVPPGGPLPGPFTVVVDPLDVEITVPVASEGTVPPVVLVLGCVVVDLLTGTTNGLATGVVAAVVAVAVVAVVAVGSPMFVVLGSVFGRVHGSCAGTSVHREVIKSVGNQLCPLNAVSTCALGIGGIGGIGTGGFPLFNINKEPSTLTNPIAPMSKAAPDAIVICAPAEIEVLPNAPILIEPSAPRLIVPAVENPIEIPACILMPSFASMVIELSL